MEILKTLFIRIPIVLFFIIVLLGMIDSYKLNQYGFIILISIAIFIFISIHTNLIQKKDPNLDILENKLLNKTPEEIAKIKKKKFFKIININQIKDPYTELIDKLENEFERRLNRPPEEMATIKKIKLFNITNINQEYKVLGMIEAISENKEKAKKILKIKAYDLGANAVLNVTSNIENDISGHVRTNRHIVSGETSTKITYHYQGTAIRV